MLIDINSSTEKVITKIPHRTSFEAWKKQIGKEAYQAIIDELNRRIDENPEVHTAGWIPGHNWEGTVFYPIYLACKKDKTAAERWSLGRYTINERDIASMTYFRLRDAK